MFRRDKTPLSGALHRFTNGVLKHRPRSGVAAIMSLGGAWVSRLVARGRVLVNVGTGHSTRSEAWLCWRWITLPGAGSSHRINTTRPARTVSRTAAPACTARQRWAMGEPLFAAISGGVPCGSMWAKAGATGQAMARTGHTAPGEGQPKHGQGHQIGQTWGKVGKKRGAAYM